MPLTASLFDTPGVSVLLDANYCVEWKFTSGLAEFAATFDAPPGTASAPRRLSHQRLLGIRPSLTHSDAH